tara:strand:- start:740 stop:1402 length:663 start_codon:yes stop_codon:yes gene_type:complete
VKKKIFILLLVLIIVGVHCTTKEKKVFQDFGLSANHFDNKKESNGADISFLLIDDIKFELDQDFLMLFGQLHGKNLLKNIVSNKQYQSIDYDKTKRTYTVCKLKGIGFGQYSSDAKITVQTDINSNIVLVYLEQRSDPDMSVRLYNEFEKRFGNPCSMDVNRCQVSNHFNEYSEHFLSKHWANNYDKQGERWYYPSAQLAFKASKTKIEIYLISSAGTTH